MKKNVAFIGLLLLGCFVAESYSQTIIAPKTVARDRPDPKATELFTLKKGDKVALKRFQYRYGPSEWYLIAHDTKTGWVLAKDMSPVGRWGIQWVEVAKTKEGTHQLDAANVKRVNRTVWVWHRMLLPKSETVAFLVRYELKCSTSEYRIVEGTQYSQTLGVKNEIIKPTEFMTVKPGRVIYALSEKVCD